MFTQIFSKIYIIVKMDALKMSTPWNCFLISFEDLPDNLGSDFVQFRFIFSEPNHIQSHLFELGK